MDSGISDESLDKFIKIYRKEFKEKITRAEAREMAQRLVILYELLLRRLPDENDASPRPTEHDDDRSDD